MGFFMLRFQGPSVLTILLSDLKKALSQFVSDADEWVGQCTIGKQQSPIEIFRNETIPITMNPFMFEFYAYPPKAESLTNNGHSIKFTLKAQREITYPKV